MAVHRGRNPWIPPNPPPDQVTVRLDVVGHDCPVLLSLTQSMS